VSDLVTITETCRCGGSTTVAVPTSEEARTLIQIWRGVHLCMSAELKDSHKSGSGSATTIGFHRQWDHDTRTPIVRESNAIQ